MANRKLAILFLILIIIMSIGRVVYFSRYQELNWSFLIFEVILLHGSLVGVGLGQWFAIVFNLKNKGIYSILVFHLVLGMVLIGGWLFFNKLVLNLVFSNSEPIQEIISANTLLNITTGVVFYLVMALSYYLAIFNQDLEEKIRQENQLQALIKEAELKNLKKQINPHFMFNSLNSISSLTLIDPEKAREMIASLSEFLRYGLKENLDRTVTLAAELVNINRYLAIEKIRFGDKLDLKERIEKDVLKMQIPQLILQPIIENAIKYGVYEATEQAYIRISAWREKNDLLLEIENDYDDSAVMKKGDGVGLFNIAERLRLLYNRNNLLKIDKSGNLYKVRLIIPQT